MTDKQKPDHAFARSRSNGGLEGFPFDVVAMDANEDHAHPLCRLIHDEWNGDYGCGYSTSIDCDECKYGRGKKDPAAKCNAL